MIFRICLFKWTPVKRQKRKDIRLRYDWTTAKNGKMFYWRQESKSKDGLRWMTELKLLSDELGIFSVRGKELPFSKDFFTDKQFFFCYRKGFVLYFCCHSRIIFIFLIRIIFSYFYANDVFGTIFILFYFCSYF